MPIVNGTRYVLQIANGVPDSQGNPAWVTVGCGTSNGWSGTRATIDGSSKCSGDFDEPIPGRSSHTYDFSGKAYPVDGPNADQLASFNELAILWKTSATRQIRMINLDDATDIIRSFAFITDLSKTSPDNDAVTFDATFQGFGEVSFTPAP